MEFVIQREAILKPLQLAAGVVEKRQTLPVLSNVLLVLKTKQLLLTATDLEVELMGRVELAEPAQLGEITVPARKLMDICKTLPDKSELTFSIKEQRLTVRSGKSRFTLSTLPAAEFPKFEDSPGKIEFSIKNKELKSVINNTHFAMAQQDVRYYLNGMLFDLRDKQLRAVATDGHRLAMSDTQLNNDNMQPMQVIVPRKAIIELARLLDDSDDEVAITLGDNFIRASTNDFTFTSKLVDGRFPDYNRVLPKGGTYIVPLQRDIFRQVLTRAAILSNEKYRGIRMQLCDGAIKVFANNPEQEEAEEELEVDYHGGELEIGFNVTYLLDALSALSTNNVKLTAVDSNSSILLEANDVSEEETGEEKSTNNSLYVIMPMRV